MHAWVNQTQLKQTWSFYSECITRRRRTRKANDYSFIIIQLL